MSDGYAQDLPQLLTQLRIHGYAQPELDRVCRAFDLANVLFETMSRGSGKAFTAHVIGVASILARHGGTKPMVIAAILHSAYAEGRWHDGEVGATESHRQAAREVLGDAAENLIYRYATFPWRQPGAIAEHVRFRRGRQSVAHDVEHQLLLMRLANEREEYLDFGNRYAPNAEARRQFRRIYGPYMLELAGVMGADALGAELESAFMADETMEAWLLAPPNPSDSSPTAIVRRDTPPDDERRLHLLDYVEHHATERPEAVAIYLRGASISWAGLLRRVAELASAIIAADATQKPVACLLSQSNMPVAMLAALHSGRVFTPIATDYPEARQRRILNAIDPGCLLVDNMTVALAPADVGAIVNIDAVKDRPSPTSIRTRSDPGNPALVIFTSGSTGEPLGVVHNETNLVTLGRRSTRALQIDSSDRLSMLSRGIHISGITDMVRSFVSGATLVPIDVATWGIETASANIRDAGVSVMHCTPSLAAAFFEAAQRSDAFKTVRLIHLGGETLAAATLASCLRSLPTDAVVINQLGCTELSGFCQAFLRAGAAPPQNPVPAGFPVEGVQVRILNDQGAPVADHETGRIVIAGEGLALGYWNEPALTAAVFREATATEPRYFLTGDRGRWLPDGQLEYRGRIDHQVQVRGYRVELAEIESALRQQEAIAEAVVIAPLVESQTTGSETEVRLVAHLVFTGGTVDLKDIQKSLGDVLPSYMQPSRYVVHDVLPRTPSGKVDRTALATMSQMSSAGTEDNVALPAGTPRPIEGDQDPIAAIKLVWTELLGLQDIGDDDNFFSIGGDSLQAMRACSRLLTLTGSGPSLRDLFDAPTPRGLASRIASKVISDSRRK